MVNLSNIIEEGIKFCREVEAVSHERYLYDLGRPQGWEEQIGIGVCVNYRGMWGFAWSEGQYSPSTLLEMAIENSHRSPIWRESSKRLSHPLPSSEPFEEEKELGKFNDLVRDLHFQLPILLPQRSFTINAQVVREFLTLANARETRRAERTIYLLTLRSPQSPPISATYRATALPATPDDIIYQLIWRNQLSCEVAIPEEEVLPAVFSPQAAGQFWGDFIEYYRHNGHTYDISPLLTIADDGTIPGALGTTICDGEGILRKRNLIIKNGRPTSKMPTATVNKNTVTIPWSSICRIWGEPPRYGYSNLDVSCGTYTISELCKIVHNGIWLDYLVPSFAQVPEGIFQRRANIAFLVHKGRPIARIPQLIVSGTFKDMTNDSLIGLSKSAQLHDRVRTPALAIAGLHLTRQEISPTEDGLDIPQLWW